MVHRRHHHHPKRSRRNMRETTATKMNAATVQPASSIRTDFPNVLTRRVDGRPSQVQLHRPGTAARARKTFAYVHAAGGNPPLPPPPQAIPREERKATNSLRIGSRIGQKNIFRFKKYSYQTAKKNVNVPNYKLYLYIFFFLIFWHVSCVSFVFFCVGYCLFIYFCFFSLFLLLLGWRDEDCGLIFLLSFLCTCIILRMYLYIYIIII